MKSWSGTAAARSDCGRVRPTNEDAVALDLDEGLFIVCDGMGGAAGGEIASRRTADEVLTSYRAHLPGPDGILQTLQTGIQRANADVLQLGADDVALRGMGTTVVALVVSEILASVAHVGDSRCYRLRSGVLEQLTRDHSFVAEQVALGTMSERDAITSPMRNVITRAVGTTVRVEPDLHQSRIEPGDIYLLATDGLTREISDREITRMLIEHAEPEAACDALVFAANQSGGRDNISCIVVRIAGR